MESFVQDLYQKVSAGDRVALGKALTLVESERDDDRQMTVELLAHCSKSQHNALRLTVSGPPGVGKSTLLEAIGLRAIKDGHKIGVLTVDPTSTISKGSILGDKSRMHNLSLTGNAFIRSSAAGSLLGGIARRSHEMMTLLSAAGFDIIFFETVGVGQSEHLAWQLTDGLILVVQPGGGDELQGIKRGITELADIVVVNKSDGDLKEEAAITRGHYQNALHYLSGLRKSWQAKVLTTSAIEGQGIEEFWEILRLYMASLRKDDQLTVERHRQNQFWLSWTLGITAHQLLLQHPDIRQKFSEGLLNAEQGKASMFTIEYEIEQAMKDIINFKSINER